MIPCNSYPWCSKYFVPREIILAMLSHFSFVQLFATPMDLSPPGSSVHGSLQARILEWVAMPSFMGSFHPRDWNSISSGSCTANRFFTGKPLESPVLAINNSKWIYIVSCNKTMHSRVGKNPRRRVWQSTPVFLPRKSHGQRSLVGYTP